MCLLSLSVPSFWLRLGFPIRGWSLAVQRATFTRRGVVGWNGLDVVQGRNQQDERRRKRVEGSGSLREAPKAVEVLGLWNGWGPCKCTVFTVQSQAWKKGPGGVTSIRRANKLAFFPSNPRQRQPQEKDLRVRLQLRPTMTADGAPVAPRLSL